MKKKRKPVIVELGEYVGDWPPVAWYETLMKQVLLRLKPGTRYRIFAQEIEEGKS